MVVVVGVVVVVVLWRRRWRSRGYFGNSDEWVLQERRRDGGRKIGRNEEGGCEVPGGYVLAELYGRQEMALAEKWQDPYHIIHVWLISSGFFLNC